MSWAKYSALREEVRRRLRRVVARGMTYREYTLEIQARGRYL